MRRKEGPAAGLVILILALVFVSLACNLPIASVDVGDVAERIDGVAGSYLCDRTPQDVAAKLRKALGSGRPTSAREKVRDLSLENVAQRLIAVYGEISERGTRAPDLGRASRHTPEGNHTGDSQ